MLELQHIQMFPWKPKVVGMWLLIQQQQIVIVGIIAYSKKKTPTVQLSAKVWNSVLDIQHVVYFFFSKNTLLPEIINVTIHFF